LTAVICLEFQPNIFQVDIARHMGQSLNVIHLVEAFEDDVSTKEGAEGRTAFCLCRLRNITAFQWPAGKMVVRYVTFGTCGGGCAVL
jgi:hypothetical protein